jgi:hypothetical protein
MKIVGEHDFKKPQAALTSGLRLLFSPVILVVFLIPVISLLSSPIKSG